MNHRVTVTISNHVADVRLNRTDKMNALDGEMFEALTTTGRDLASNPDVRCVVLSGNGKAFCAGIDVSRFGGSKDAGSMSTGGVATLTERTHGIANRPQYAAWVWHEMPVPVIAAVHGVAFGGGFQIMLGADMRYIAPETKLSIMEIKWGLVPDMAGTVLMRRLVREDVARELTYTGRVFSGNDALEYGFATRVCEDPLEQAMATAQEIAAKSPSAIEAAKRLYNQSPDIDARTGLMLEAVEQQSIRGQPNQTESAKAAMEKRAGNFVSPRAVE